MQINLMPDLSLLAIMVIFIANYWIVRKFFLQPINAVLEAREAETKGAEKVYEDALSRFSDATSQMEVQLHNAKREAAQVRERFRSEAGAHRSEMVEKTSAQAKQSVAEADVKLSADVKAAREKIARDSEALAKFAAERILGRAV
jgi:F0F1-type ATP synthase membrane subunit b/b'